MSIIGIDGEYIGDYYSDLEADNLYDRREELMAEGLSFNEAYKQSVDEMRYREKESALCAGLAGTGDSDE